MKATIRFVAVPTVDTTGTLLEISFEKQRYLFGRIAEGAQRALLQNGANLVKTSDCFITGPTEWNSVGGLTGMALTHCDVLAQSTADLPKDAARPKLVVRGASGLLHSVAVGRKYILRFGDHVEFQEFQAPSSSQQANQIPDFEDAHISVWALPIRKEARSRTFSIATKRKRGSEEAHEDLLPEETTEQNQDTLVGIVKDMWSNSGRRDALVETELSNVQMPVKNIWVRNPGSKDLEEYQGPLPGGTKSLPNPELQVLVRLPWSSSLIPDLPSVSVQHESRSYIIKTRPVRGKFLPGRAKELGVPAGPLFAELTEGHFVVTPKGETVTPDMVLEPERPSNSIAIIDLPTLEYVSGFLRRPEWENAETMTGLQAFVWILGFGISSAPEIADFMTRHSHLKHFVASSDHCPNIIAMETAAQMLDQLAAINPLNFRRLSSDSPLSSHDSASLQKAMGSALPHCATPVSLDLSIDFRPAFGVSRKEYVVTRGSISQLVQEYARSAEQKNNENKAHLDSWKSTIGLPDAEVIFLGTGSAIPSMTRNVTGTLIRVPGHGNYILDCGENTIGQLRRMFSGAEISEILRDLRMIWISHIHADHQLGTIGVLKAWYEAVHQSRPLELPSEGSITGILEQIKANHEATSRPYLPVVASKSYLSVLQEFSAIEDIGFSRVLPIYHESGRVKLSTAKYYQKSRLHLRADLMSHKGVHKSFCITPELHRMIFGPVKIDTVYVRHCTDSSAVALTFLASDSNTKPFKVAWSGDCRPSLAFAVIGNGADVLIHEATFGDDSAGQAKAKNHSTISEAILVAEAMKAKSLILTHFSQRYPKLPNFHDINANSGANAAANAVKKLLPSKLQPTDEQVDSELESDGDIEVDRLMVEEDVDKEMAPEAMIDASGKTPESTIEGIVSPERGGAVSIPLRICAAFDYMRIKVGDIARMEAYTDALLESFKEKEKETEESKEEDFKDAELQAQAKKSEKQKRRKALKREKEQMQ